MSSESPETTPPSPAEPSTAPGPDLAVLLVEAKATRDVLTGFAQAIHRGTFEGADAVELAKGVAFLEAIVRQNQAHIDAIEARIKEKKS